MKIENTTARKRNAFPTIHTDLLDSLTDTADRLLEEAPVVKNTSRPGFFRRLIA